MSQLGRGQALGQAGDAATRRALEAHLVACVHRSLEDAIFSNAIFLCERLVAEFRSEVRRQPELRSARGRAERWTRAHGERARARLGGPRPLL